MRLESVELVNGAQLPGRRAGSIGWNTSLDGSQYELELEGNHVRATHLESGETLIYPWASVRHAVPRKAPAADVAPSVSEPASPVAKGQQSKGRR